jgi:uncharacterized membrane protein YccC
MLRMQRPFFTAVTGVIICGPDLGTTLKNSWHGSMGLLMGALLGATVLGLLGNEASPEVIFCALFVVSVLLLYPASLPPLFQKLGFGVLAMTLFDSHDAALGRHHPWQLAWVPA